MTTTYTASQATAPAVMYESNYANSDWATDIAADSTLYKIFGHVNDFKWPDPAHDNNIMKRGLNTTTRQPNIGRIERPPVLKGSFDSWVTNGLFLPFIWGAGIHAGSDPYSHIYPHTTADSRTLSGDMKSFSLHRELLKSGDNIITDYLGTTIPTVTLSWQEGEALRMRGELWSSRAVAGTANNNPTTNIVDPIDSVEKQYTHAGDEAPSIDINGAVSAIVKSINITLSSRPHPLRTLRTEDLTPCIYSMPVGPVDTTIELDVVPLDSNLETLLRGRSFAGNDVDITLSFWKEGESSDDNDEIGVQFTYCDLLRAPHSVTMEQFIMNSKLTLVPKTSVWTVYDAITDTTGAGRYIA